MNTIEEIKKQAQYHQQILDRKQKREEVQEVWAPRLRELIFSKYGDVSKLVFEYGKLRCNLRETEGRLSVQVRTDGGYSNATVVLYADWDYSSDITRFTVKSDGFHSFKTPEEAVDSFVKNLATWHSVTPQSLIDFANSIPEEEVYVAKCQHCGNTQEFYATALTHQRVSVDAEFSVQEGLDCPDYEFSDIVCAACGSCEVLRKSGGER